MSDKKQQQILQELAAAFAGDTGQKAAAAPAEEDMNSRVIMIDNVDDFKLISEFYKDALIVINFTAKWYQPSQHFLRQFVAMAEVYKGAAFCLVDIDEVKAVAQSLNVTAPMFRLYRSGKQLTELSGLNVLGNTTELQTVLTYEIENAGAKMSDKPLPPILPEQQQDQQHQPTLKLMKNINKENQQGSQDNNPSSSSAFSFGESVSPWAQQQQQSDSSMERPAQRQKLYQFFPHLEYIYWQSASYQNIQKKLLEFNDNGSAGWTLSSEERDAWSRLIAVVEQENRYHSSAFEANQFRLIEKLALSWNAQHLLPVLDTMRVMALHPDAAERFFAEQRVITELLEPLIKNHLSETSAVYANQLMTLRLLANLFRFAKTRSVIHALVKEPFFLPLLDQLTASTNKNIQTALSTLLLNMTVLLCQENQLEQALEAVTYLAIKMIKIEQNDDSLFRLIVVLGTAALASKNLNAKINSELVDTLAKLATSSEKSADSLAELKKILNNSSSQ